jgi:hypothetical protein
MCCQGITYGFVFGLAWVVHRIVLTLTGGEEMAKASKAKVEAAEAVGMLFQGFIDTYCEHNCDDCERKEECDLFEQVDNYFRETI